MAIPAAKFSPLPRRNREARRFVLLSAFGLLLQSRAKINAKDVKIVASRETYSNRPPYHSLSREFTGSSFATRTRNAPQNVPC